MFLRERERERERIRERKREEESKSVHLLPADSVVIIGVNELQHPSNLLVRYHLITFC
jgi:hypothetical protein